MPLALIRRLVKGSPLTATEHDTNLNVLEAGIAASLQPGQAIPSDVECRNNSGVGLTAGAPVYITSSSGTKPTVALADASSESTAARSLGLIVATVANNTDCVVRTHGILTGVNTAALTEGLAVWLSETTGQLTSTRPTQPAHGVFFGFCVKQAAGTAGILYISVTNGQELGELHDVLLTGAATDDVLALASDGLWKPKALGGSSNNYTYPATGAVTRTIAAKLSDYVDVRDFGAIGNGVADDTAAIQAAINTGKPAYMQSGPNIVYKITQTLTLNKSYQALIGDEGRPLIRKTTAGPAIQVISTAADPLNLYAVVANLNIESTVTPVFQITPTKADAGIVLDGALSPQGGSVKYTRIENIRISNWSVGYYSNDVVNGSVINVYAHLLNDYSAVTGYTSANKFIGFLLECTPFAPYSISPQASNEYIICDAVGLRTPANVQSIGYYVVGEDLRDCFFDSCETAVTSIGWYIKTTTSDLNWDIHIRRPIVDAYGLYGIWIDGVNGPGAVTINGGYIVGAGASSSHGIYILNSTGVTVTGGVQILGYTNNGSLDAGVRIEGGNGNSIIGNNFQNLNYPITLLNSAKLCSIVGNTIFASATATESSPTLNEAIRLLSGSEENTVVGNTIRGKDLTDVYEVGISVGAGCPRNVISSNSIDADGSVTTPYMISDATTTVYTNNMIQAGGRLALRGNDATYPVVFQNAAGTVIAKISAAGVFSAGAP